VITHSPLGLYLPQNGLPIRGLNHKSRYYNSVKIRLNLPTCMSQRLVLLPAKPDKCSTLELFSPDQENSLIALTVSKVERLKQFLQADTRSNAVSSAAKASPSAQIIPLDSKANCLKSSSETVGNRSKCVRNSVPPSPPSSASQMRD